MTLPEAIAAIQDADLVQGGPRYEQSDAVPQDLVIRTEPPAGERVDAGSTVDIIVSAGPLTATEEPDL